jgi:hypothetical protein
MRGICPSLKEYCGQSSLLCFNQSLLLISTLDSRSEVLGVCIKRLFTFACRKDHHRSLMTTLINCARMWASSEQSERELQAGTVAESINLISKEKLPSITYQINFCLEYKTLFVTRGTPFLNLIFVCLSVRQVVGNWPTISS